MGDLPQRLSGRLVVCAGVYRSGSTWAYNMLTSIIRMALPNIRVGGQFAENVDELSQLGLGQFDLIVLKTHPQLSMLRLIEFLRPPIVVSVRDPRDCMASWIEMAADSFALFQPRLMKSCSVALELKLQNYAHVIRYEDDAMASPRTVLGMAAHLGLQISERQADLLIRELSTEAVKKQIKQMTDSGKINPNVRLVGDPRTLWLPAHIGDGKSGKYQSALTRDQVRSIESWSRLYCEAFDYDVPARLPIPRGKTVLAFGMGSDATAYLESGFSYPESGFTWTDGTEATIALPLDVPISGLLECKFRYFKAASAKAPAVRLVIMLIQNGVVVRTILESKEGGSVAFSVDDPRVYGAQSLCFRVAISNPYCPKAHNDNNDDRWLGMALQAISVEY